MKYIVKKFDSMSQYSRYLNTTQMSDLFKKFGCEGSKKNSAYFAGTESWEEAESLMKFGDRENLAKLQKLVVKTNMKGTGESKRTETYRSFVGYAPHVPSYVAGQPKTMLRKKVVRTTNAKVLNIVYSPVAHAAVEVDELLEASLRVMNFISSLEKQGYKVNLYSQIMSKKGSETAGFMVKIKSSDDYTDMAKIVYPMVHPSFLRRHFFRFMEVTEGITNEDFCRTYGTPVFEKKDVEGIWKQLGIRVDYYFNFYEHTYQLKQATKRQSI